MSLVLVLRVLITPGMDAACFAAPAACDTGHVAMTCCAGGEACECCMGEPQRVPPHEPTAPTDAPSRATLHLAVDPGTPTRIGFDMGVEMTAAPRLMIASAAARPVSRAAAAVLCVWRT